MDETEKSYESLMKYCESRNLHPKSAMKTLTGVLIPEWMAEKINVLLVERQDSHGWIM